MCVYSLNTENPQSRESYHLFKLVQKIQSLSYCICRFFFVCVCYKLKYVCVQFKYRKSSHKALVSVGVNCVLAAITVCTV